MAGPWTLKGSYRSPSDCCLVRGLQRVRWGTHVLTPGGHGVGMRTRLTPCGAASVAKPRGVWEGRRAEDTS